MARILVRGEWYYSLSSTAYFEVEYERIVMDRATDLFPDHFAVEFKMTVESEFGRAQADLALIERQYRKWWVVEIELSHHSLYGHVVPQIQKLASATYGEDVAQYLSSRSTDLDIDRLRRMLKGSQPQVLVVVNQHKPEWPDALAPYGSTVAIAELFRSNRNDHVLRLNGEYPDVPGDVLSVLRPDSVLPRLLKVDSPAALPQTGDSKLLIEFDGGLTEWSIVVARDSVWLAPVKNNPLPPGRAFAVISRDDGRLELRLHRD